MNLSNLEKQRYDSIFELVQLIIAYPHTTLTQNDKLRAVILISFLDPYECELTEYLYSQLTAAECKVIRLMRDEITSKRKAGEVVQH